MSSLQTARFPWEKGWQRRLVSVPMRSSAYARFVLPLPRSSPPQQIRRAGGPSSHASRQTGSKKTSRLHEKSYPSDHEEQDLLLLPEMRAKATGDDVGDLPCEGRKWGKIRPAGTISREVMRIPCTYRVERYFFIASSFLSNSGKPSAPGECLLHLDMESRLDEERSQLSGAMKALQTTNSHQPVWEKECAGYVRNLFTK